MSHIRFCTALLFVLSFTASLARQSYADPLVGHPRPAADEKTPVINGVTPPSIAPGGKLTIAGTEFGSPDKNSVVKFNDKPVKYQLWQDEKIEVVVPKTTPPGKLTIVVAAGGKESNKYDYTLKRAAVERQSACASPSIETQLLDPSDAPGVAKLLNSIFPDLKFEAHEKPGSTSNSGKDGSTTPDGTLCATVRATGKPLENCTEVAKAKTPLSLSCEISGIVRGIDIEGFKKGKLNSNFIVHLQNPDTTPHQPNSFAEGLTQYFAYPAANLEIRPATQDYYLLIPSPGGVEQAGKSGVDLSAQAGFVKRDLEQLDKLYRDAVADDKLKQAVLCNTGCECSAGLTAHPDKAQIDIERWLAKHTARLSILKPRDAALALQDYTEWRFQVRSFGQAVTVLPAKFSDLCSHGAYLSADAIERDLLYHQKSDEDKAASSKSGDAGGKSSNPAPAPTTTQSTTTFETLSGGKPTSPALTAKITTTTGTAPAASSSTPAPANTSSSKTSTSNQAPGSDASNSDVTQSGNSTESSGKMSADNSTSTKGADASSGGSTPPATPPTPSQSPLRLDNVVRLFHLRQADKIAAAINAAAPKSSPLVQAVDDNGNNDLILILPSPAGGADQTTSIRRSIAMFDLPRPQLSLQVWSYQMSAAKSSKPFEIQDSQDTAAEMRTASTKLTQKVNGANDAMTRALEAGFGALLTQARAVGYFKQNFKDYLTQRFNECLPRDKYCLGYYDAFDVPDEGETAANASLNRLLLYLIAANDGAAPLAARKVICAMNQSQSDSCKSEATLSKAECSSLVSAPGLNFRNFCERITLLAQPRNLHIFQAALLDFLFQYKWTVVYPDDFVPYDLQRTAHVLDSLFGPIVDGFNQDLDLYVSTELDNVALCIRKILPEKNIGLISAGTVQVSSLSGSQALVDGKVSNYFDITPPLSLNDILNGANQQNVADKLAHILQPKEILILQALANIGNQPRITAQVSKEAKLTITPTTLDEASSAALDVDFDVSEPNAPQTVNQQSSQQDLLDRVAEHHVTTHVRVESLKLFQLSSFTMELTHPLRGTPVPIIGWGWEAIFGTTPGLGRLFRMPPYSRTVDNRSIAIVRAVVVPTAMDLGLSLRFEGDRIFDPITYAMDPLNSMKQAGGRLRPFHKCFVRLIVDANAGCPTDLSSTAEDLRDPTTP